MPTLTVAKEVSWVDALKAEFDRAVQALRQGAVPSSIKPLSDQLTNREWLALLEAARTEVTRGRDGARDRR